MRLIPISPHRLLTAFFFILIFNWGWSIETHASAPRTSDRYSAAWASTTRRSSRCPVHTHSEGNAGDNGDWLVRWLVVVIHMCVEGGGMQE